jgi:NarL family two-component system response regulator LiaR
MKRRVLMLGMVGGLLLAGLRWSEYRFLVLEHSVEIYAGLIAAVFAGLGIWLGWHLTGRRKAVEAEPVAGDEVAGYQAVTTLRASVSEVFAADERRREELGITRREMEILALVAEGMSNREIGERLFVSENTVKTHCSRVFDKLGARRRTQAVQMGKELGLLG